MRLPRLLLVLSTLFLVGSPLLRADDTQEFLDPKNWEGNMDIWKVEKDFELTFKVKLTDGIGNSGVQFRSEVTDAKKFVVKGLQADIGKGYWGSLYGEGIGGMVMASDPKVIDKVVKEKEVNDYQIIAKGSKVTIKINGEAMVDGDFPKLPGKKDAKDFAADGVIAFQAHAGYPKMKVEFLEIKFTKLK
jgi:Domain of Unknown Function (DUF1080)